MAEILYKNNIYSSDFSSALKKIGISERDTIFMHSNILAFGRIATDTTLQSLINEIKTVVSSGDILMPTYTYSFTKDEIYDVENTPSRVGSLTNYFRKLPSVYRTLDPIFSVAVLGDDKYMECDDKDCFGENSIYSELLKSKAKIVMFGSEFSRSLTFLHFVEQQFGVYYRKLKKFHGKKKINNKIFEDYCYFYAREPRNIVVNLDRLEQHLINKDLLKTIEIGYGRISTIDINELYNQCIVLLQKDQNFFLDNEN
tara:strand:+ start:288 stop:1055 length:768 start_codon:yes stop_codon:yes gene_type:complete